MSIIVFALITSCFYLPTVKQLDETEAYSQDEMTKTRTVKFKSLNELRKTDEKLIEFLVHAEFI